MKSDDATGLFAEAIRVAESVCRAHSLDVAWMDSPSETLAEAVHGVMAEARRDGFFVAWLDAVWSAFSESEDRMDIPTDVRRELVRRGWLKPRTRSKKDDTRTVSITPEGMRVVVAANLELGLARDLYGPEGEKVDAATWLAKYDERGAPADLIDDEPSVHESMPCEQVPVVPECDECGNDEPLHHPKCSHHPDAGDEPEATPNPRSQRARFERHPE